MMKSYCQFKQFSFLRDSPVIVMLSFLTVIVANASADVVNTEIDSFSSPSTCNNDDECKAAIHPKSICRTIESLGVQRCICNPDTSFYKVGQSCEYRARIGELCLATDTICLEDHAVCKRAPESPIHRRCVCDTAYTEVTPILENVFCGRELFSLLDPTCKECETNEGICYDSTGDQISEGCQCPQYRSGDNCEKSHVQIICDINHLHITVCYTPHSWMDMDGSSVMLTDGKGGDTMCRGISASSDQAQALTEVQGLTETCPGDTWQVSLSIKTGELERCGVQEIDDEAGRTTYRVNVIVLTDEEKNSPQDIAFGAYCSFQTSTYTKFQALGVRSMVREDRGSLRGPEVGLTVQNIMGRPIAIGTALRLGDKVRFHIKMEEDGTYGAVFINQCTASNQATLTSSRAITVPLIINGCPNTKQKIITYRNTFRPVVGRLNELITGTVTMFKLAAGDTVHIHCFIKLCLKTEQGKCASVLCTSPHQFAGYGRKKRSEISEDQNARQSKATIDESEEMEVAVHLAIPIDFTKTSRTNPADELDEIRSDNKLYMIVLWAVAALMCMLALCVICACIRMRRYAVLLERERELALQSEADEVTNGVNPSVISLNSRAVPSPLGIQNLHILWSLPSLFGGPRSKSKKYTTRKRNFSAVASDSTASGEISLESVSTPPPQPPQVNLISRMLIPSVILPNDSLSKNSGCEKQRVGGGIQESTPRSDNYAADDLNEHSCQSWHIGGHPDIRIGSELSSIDLYREPKPMQTLNVNNDTYRISVNTNLSDSTFPSVFDHSSLTKNSNPSMVDLNKQVSNDTYDIVKSI